MSDRPQSSLNVICVVHLSLTQHVACLCLITLDTRNNWWIDILNCSNIYLSAELCVLPDNELIMLLGRQPNMELDTCAIEGFCINNFKLIPHTSAQYNHFMHPHDDLQNGVNYLTLCFGMMYVTFINLLFVCLCPYFPLHFSM